MKIPTPRFAVFYNGVEDQPERYTLKLSDAYAINKAIDRCIEENVLREFMRRRRGEVTKVTILDYTFERRIELEREEAREEERANTERERKAKEEERQRAEQERQAKELAEKEVQRLRAELEQYKRQCEQEV